MSTTQETVPNLFYKSFQGSQVPALGFGTFELKGSACRDAVSEALDVGYRHVDTARGYGNEAEVGQAMASSAVPREDIFLTSKIWRDQLAPDQIRAETAESLKLLQTDHLDLMLIHWPNPDFSLRDAIEALEDLRSEGLVRHFGVSNFTPDLLDKALSYGKVFCDQVEYHPLLSQDALLAVTRKHDIILTAYSPLGQGEILDSPELQEIAAKHGKNAAQVAIRWLLEQSGVVAIPRSADPEHIKSNFEVFDFSLDDEDHERIALLPKDRRQIDPEFAPDWSR